jgi:serine/threonine protein kinase
MAELIAVPGGDGPVNEGERRVIAALLQRLPTNYWVAANVELADQTGQILDYDAIVIAPHAVYVLEIKDWRPAIRGDEREWQVGASTRRAPLLVTERKAKVLKTRLVARAAALGRVRVEAAVVLASQPEVLELTPAGSRRVFLLHRLLAFLTDPAQVGQQPSAIGDLVSPVVRVLGSQLQGRTSLPAFGSYEATELLEQKGDETIYRARHRLLPGAPPVRLRVIRISPYALTPEQQAERRAGVVREVEALLRMGSHPNIIGAREAIPEGDAIALVLDGTEGRSLRQRLRAGTPLTVQERFEILIDVCRALAHAHAHGVIHRHVEPSSIILGEDGTTRLGDFTLAKIQNGHAATVWNQETSEDIDPRFLAPELAATGYGPPTPATDLYGLGCVGYELFGGRPPFQNATEAFGPMPPLPEGTPRDLVDLLPKLLAGTPERRWSDTAAVLAALQAMRPTDTPRPVTGPKDRYEPGDLIDNDFEVREQLGQGGFSTVYRVYRALDDQEYALKVFVGDSYTKVQREIGILRRLSDPPVTAHIVRAVWAASTRAGQWYLVTELLRGDTLAPYAQGTKRLSPEEVVQVGVDLLSALEAIHPNAPRIAELEAKVADGQELEWSEYQELQGLKTQGIVHRDIKPQNILLTERGVVLIDFNIASKVGQKVETVSGTPPYQSPDLVANLESWDVSPDLFAVGVVLYELLCYEHPYENATPRMDRLPRDPRGFRPEVSAGLAAFLVGACMPSRRDRFSQAREMREALQSISPLVDAALVEADPGVLPSQLRDLLENAPPNVNPMVREFLALSSQARRTNRGTRGLDDLARATYVETELDQRLGSSVLEGRHRLVLVTGNAGDGKTAFIQQVEALARRRNAVVEEQTSSGARLRYAGQEIITLYDGSQDDEDRSSDDMLRRFFAPFAADGHADGAVRLAAINEGRLRDFLLSHRDVFPRLAADVIATLDDPEAAPANDEVVVVNLNLRSVAAGGENSIFSRQLQKIVGGPFWGPCEVCDYRSRCPLKHNVDTFRDETSGPSTSERLRVLIDLIRLRRRRHLTMRDIRSLIAHLLFRDRVCEEVPGLLQSDNPFTVLDITYFQGVAGKGVPDGTAVERGAALLEEIDVGLSSNPEDDRALAQLEGPRLMQFPVRSSEYPTGLITELRRQAGAGYEANARLARVTHQAARRQAYFERADDDWRAMLPYKRLREFDKALDPGNVAARERLLGEIIRAISMHEQMYDIERAAKALWLATNEESDYDYWCFRRFPLDEFELRIAEIQAPYVEAQPDRLDLVHRPSNATLKIDVDLLEVLERLQEGYTPTSDEGQGFMVNLRLFKHQLLAEPMEELLLDVEDEMARIVKGAQRGTVVLESLVR